MTSLTKQTIASFIKNLTALIPEIVAANLDVEEGQDASDEFAGLIDSLTETLTAQVESDFEDLEAEHAKELAALEKKHKAALTKAKKTAPAAKAKAKGKKTTSSGEKKAGNAYSFFVKAISGIVKSEDDGVIAAEKVTCGDHFTKKTTKTYEKYDELREDLALEETEHTIGELVEVLKSAEGEPFKNVVIMTAAIWGLIDPERRKELADEAEKEAKLARVKGP